MAKDLESKLNIQWYDRILPVIGAMKFYKRNSEKIKGNNLTESESNRLDHYIGGQVTLSVIAPLVGYLIYAIRSS